MPKPDNLYQRGSVWYARVQVSGSDRRVSLKTADRKEAERRLKLFLAENSPYHGTIRRSFDDVVDQFLAEARSRLKPSTVERYETSALQLADKFTGRFWDTITRKSVVEYIDERKATGTKIPTIRRDLTVLSQAAEWAIEHEISAINPVREIGKRQLRYKQPVFIRPDERSIEATILACYGNVKPLARFLLATGMRRDEAKTLEWEQVSNVRRVATLTKTKNGNARAVALSDAAVAILDGQAKGRWVFPNQYGNPYTNPSTYWRDARDRAQMSAQSEGWKYVPFRLHDLRHLYAIEYLAAGGSLYRLQRQLGHGTIGQTEAYLAYLSPEEAARAKDAMD
jgi:integrase